MHAGFAIRRMLNHWRTRLMKLFPPAMAAEIVLMKPLGNSSSGQPDWRHLFCVTEKHSAISLHIFFKDFTLINVMQMLLITIYICNIIFAPNKSPIFQMIILN